MCVSLGVVLSFSISLTFINIDANLAWRYMLASQVANIYVSNSGLLQVISSTFFVKDNGTTKQRHRKLPWIYIAAQKRHLVQFFLVLDSVVHTTTSRAAHLTFPQAITFPPLPMATNQQRQQLMRRPPVLVLCFSTRGT